MDMKTPVDENKVNAKMNSLLNKEKDTVDSNGEPVKDISNKNPAPQATGSNMMNGGLMSFTQIMEAMDAAAHFEDFDNADLLAEDDNKVDMEALLDELNKLYTPVLVNQNFEKEIAAKSSVELESAKVLTERSIIQFDDETRYSQLVAVCAKLIAKQKNTEAWQMYKKAAVVKQQAGLAIQEQEHDEAKELAQKYLVKVSTTNGSSVARNAATELLPQTNKND